MDHHQLSPANFMASTNFVPNMSFLQDPDTASSSHLITRPYMVNPFTGFQLQTDVGSQGGKAPAGTICCFESLDCFLSAAAINGSKGTSSEDDGTNSRIVSDRCRNFWNFEASAVSSEGFENISHAAASTRSILMINDKNHEVKDAGAKNDDFGILQSDSRAITEGSFKFIFDNLTPKQKKPRSEKIPSSAASINFQLQLSSSSSVSSSSMDGTDPEAIAQMKEMIYRAAVFRPVNMGLEMVEKPKRKNVRLSNDPHAMAARRRRERISERIRVLQRLVPSGNKMDTASMLDEAANYIKFLRSQVKAFESLGHKLDSGLTCPSTSNISFSYNINPSFPMQKYPFFTPNPN